MSPRTCWRGVYALAVVACATMLVPDLVLAQETVLPERFAGVWARNDSLSQDWQPKIDQSAGSVYLRGGGRERLLPSGGGEGDLKRLQVRQRLERAAASVSEIEIELAPNEFRVITSDDDLRIFYLDRKHLRQSPYGTSIEVESVWDGRILTLNEKADDGTVFSESYSHDEANDQLALVVHLTNKRFNAPFIVRTVFDRVTE